MDRCGHAHGGSVAEPECTGSLLNVWGMWGMWGILL